MSRHWNKRHPNSPRLLMLLLLLAAAILGLSASPSLANPNWSGTGHFVLETIGYTPSPYTVQPNFRQASTSTGAATSTISSADSADLFVNFAFDTSGKTIYLVYTTNGSAPNKTNGASVTATFSNYSEPNRTWRVSIPTQAASTVVNYVFYASDNSLANSWGRISGTTGNRNTSQYQISWTETDTAYFTYTVTGGPTATPTPTPTAIASPTATPTATSTPLPSAITVTAGKAMWLDAATIAWNGVVGSSYKLLYDPDGGLTTAAEGAACSFPAPAAPCYVSLTSSGTVSGYPKNPNATGKPRLLTGLTADNAKFLLKGQVVVASYNSGGVRVDATRAQIQSVLDALYAASAKTQTLGVTYSAGAPAVKLWAPTAKTVTLRRYATAAGAEVGNAAMTLDAASGVWSVTGAAGWDRQFYLFDVEVYVPSVDAVVNNLVTDPYSFSLSQDGAAAGDVRSQFANLADADLKPAGWDSLVKPALTNPEDMVIYEMHVRDFSISDSTVAAADRGAYKAFTYDGAGPHPNTTLSDGMSHLLKLKDAGLTHVHLLPAFDIASVIEPAAQRTEPSFSFNPATDRASSTPQAAVWSNRLNDGFNWGYDPYHYGVPEGSYSSDPNGVTRILEFRDMVKALNQNGLRVVMDVVYNHTAASGQDDHSVLDKVVPGYYYRYDANGTLYNSSCCSDTAAEYEMMEKLMIDTVVRFAVDYKVDSFRFDLMNLHTRQNMLNLKNTVQALTVGVNGVDGSKIYIYGEGWDFGSALDKGLTTCPDCYAKQYNMTGAGIGAFNDRIRDAAHGGFSEDPLEVRKQGFINGLHYDWNAYCYGARFQSNLWSYTADLRTALAGSGNFYTDDPQETVNYIEKHDNETLFDLNVFRLPNGAGDPGPCGSSYVPPVTSMADRVRSQNMGISLIGLAQGIPFIQMGSDIQRSKSLDRDSYDSGDWFNRVDWSYGDSTYSNNFGVGLPVSAKNSARWPIMTPLLNNTALDPAPVNAQAGAAHLREILRIRKSSPLFRLTTEADANARVFFYNTDNSKDALIVMALSDEPSPDLDANYETLLTFFNANKISQSYTVPGAAGLGFTLHPVHTDGVDDDPLITGGATFDNATGTFTIPARTTVVFVSTQVLAAPSTLDWVGLMYPRGGVANSVNESNFASSGFDVYAQVYEAGVTPGAGQGAGIACFLHWGKYGQAWSDLAMTYNTDKGNNDEYKGTIPQAALNALASGTYGFTTYCKKTSETGVKWKEDSYDIGGVGADDDQGDGLITVIPAGDPRPAPAGGVFVHLFEWRWADIEKECTYLAQKGYSAVQVSPPNEHLVPTASQGGQATAQYPWWVRYQPVTHLIGAFTSRSGTWTEFQSMVSTCNSLGVAVYVDAVINHMADIQVGTPPAGTAGTQYQSTPAASRFYGAQYQADDFHSDCTISDYGDRNQVQSCKLSGLPDLNTGKADVQTELRNYLQALINTGVKGFRVDGAKHMAAQDIAGIFNGLTGNFYVFQEVIDQSSSERVRDWEYTPYGDVTEFSYPFALGAAFDDACSGSLSDLQNRFSQSDMLPSRFAQVFTDNHDNQRGHGVGAGCVVDHRDGQEHVLANIFALAYPYGYPSVMSSYYWQSSSTDNTNDSYGPPTVNGGPGSSGATLPVYGSGQSAGDTPVNCASSYTWGKWACEHRRTSTANMALFRLVTANEAVTNWQNVGGAPSDHMAFGRGDKGFVAINRTASSAVTTYATGMAAGDYCDIVHYDFIPATGRCVLPGSMTDAPTLITVNASGQIVNQTVASMDAFAIHVAARMNDTDYGYLPLVYGVSWHTQVANNPILGVLWRTDDGVTRNAWTETTGSVNLTVNGANGFVTAWFDWNQDGDFTDSGEQAFANEEVVAGQTQAKTFARGAWSYTQPLNARFRVYPSAQTMQALADAAAPAAAPQPSGGASGGEVEDYVWTFNPLAVMLADFSAVQQGDAVLVTWETNNELNNRGFNVWRGVSPAAPDRRLNDTLIPSQSSGSGQGFSYQWLDASDLVSGTTYYYWIEDVDIYGAITRHGPVSVTFQTPTAISLRDASSPRRLPSVWPLIAVGLIALAGLAVVWRRSRRMATERRRAGEAG